MLKIFVTLLLITALEPQSVTMQEFFQRECDKGNQQACERAENLSAGMSVQLRINDRSEKFWDSVDTSTLMLDKKPNLQAAYPLVMHDYFDTLKLDGVNETLDEEQLPQCSRHYHNHWINKKLWYPANDDGTPDWPAIYVYIVDHYYGFCLNKKAF